MNCDLFCPTFSLSSSPKNKNFCCSRMRGMKTHPAEKLNTGRTFSLCALVCCRGGGDFRFPSHWCDTKKTLPSVRCCRVCLSLPLPPRLARILQHRWRFCAPDAPYLRVATPTRGVCHIGSCVRMTKNRPQQHPAAERESASIIPQTPPRKRQKPQPCGIFGKNIRF